MGKITYSILRPEHASELEMLQITCFPNVDPALLFSKEDFLHLVRDIPELVYVALDGSKPVGLGSGIFADFDFDNPQHNLDKFIGGGRCTNHDNDGDWYYGTDLSVDPRYRRRGIGRQLYKLRKQVARRFNRRGIIAGGVLPGYAKYRHRLTTHEYVERVASGELYDPTLSFQLRNGFKVKGVLQDYFQDRKAGAWASLIVWENPDYRSVLGHTRQYT